MAKQAIPKPARVTTADVAERLHVHPTTIWRKCKAGEFPAPHYIGERKMWFLAEIEAWERAQMARPATERRGSRNLVGGADDEGVQP